jgi:hypothetical protein
VAIDEQQHVALPKLMGQPAYARPPRHVTMASVRPLDPDDLPLEAFLDGDELHSARELRSQPYVAIAVGATDPRSAESSPQRQGGFRVKFFGRRDKDSSAA